MGDASGASGTGEAVLAVNSNSKAGNDASAAADAGFGTYLGSSSDLTLTDNATTEDLTADRTVGGESGEDEGGDDGVGQHSASQLGSGGGLDNNDDLDDDDVYVLDGDPPPPPDSPPPPLDGDHNGGGDGDDPNPPREDRSESTSSSMSIDRNALLNDDDLMVLAAVPARGPLARGSSDPTLTDNATSTATGTSDTDDELDDWERFEDDMLCSSDGGDVGVGGSGVRLGGSGEGGTSADGAFSDRASKRQSLIIETSFDDLSFLEDEEAASPSDPLFASNNGLLTAAAGEGGENEALSALREKLSLMNFSRKRERRPTGDRAPPGQRRTRSLSDGDIDESVMRKLRRRRAQDDAFGFSPTSDASERSFDDTLIFEVDMTDEIIRDLQGEGKYSGLGSRVVSAPVDIDAESSAESDDAARSPTSPLAGAIGNGGRQKAKSIGGRRNSKSRGVSTGLAKEAFANRLAMIKNKTNLSKVASMPSVAEVAAEVRSIAEASALSFPAPSDLPDPMFDLEIGGSDEAGSSDDPAPRSRSPSRKGKRPRQLSSTLKRGASLADLRETRSQRQGRALSVSTIAHELAHDLSERALEIQALEDQLADHRFNVEDSEDNIIFEKEDAAAVQQQNQGLGRKQKVRQLVRAATLEKLVERLTFDRFVDRSYMSAFLLTFRSFVTPSQLMALLRVRFVATPPDGLRGEELQVWKKTKQIPIRLRVMNALKVWIEHHFDDFAQSKELVEALSGFMDLMIAVDMAKQAEHLRKLLLKQLSGGGRTNAVVATGDPPTPHKIPSKKKLSLLDIHPEEVARQLTVVESKMFRAIEATELLGLAWSKEGREERARNVLAMSGRFNEVSRWVATEVLASPRTKVRAVIINRFITIAHKCRLLHNFNSTMEIMAGLQLAPIHRLKQSWALIPTKGMELFDDLVSLVAQYKNFSVMRRVLRSVGEAACVPYLGIYLTDLTFVEEGNPNMISSVLPLHFVYSGDNDFVSHEFDTRTTINDVRAEIVAELGSAIDDAQDRLLWLPGRDPASPGVWLPLNHRLRDHDIQSNSMIHLRSRHAIIRVRVEDNFKSMRLDLTNSVSALVEAIVAGLRLPNPEDFLLVTEDDRALQPNLALWEQGINAENEVLKIKFNFIQKAITPASDPRLIQILYDRASKLVRSVACPVAKEYAVLLTSLSVLAATGGSADIGALDILDFVPLDWAEKYNKKMAKAIRSQIKELATTGITDVEAKVQFFELTSRQPSYGGEVLSCGMRVKKKVSPVHIALKNKTLVIMDAKTNTVVGSYQLDAVRSLRRDADEVYWQLPKALVKREVICFIFPEVRMAKWHFMMVQEHLREMDVLPPPSHNYIPIARNLLAQISAGRGASGGAEQETIHLINFAKRRRTYEIVATIQHFQKTSRKYALTPLPALIRWLDDRPRMDEDDLHARSREVEERVPR